ncbi:MAG: SDR family NAD(P)-dependent oxidoreductase [bacterium]
MKKVIIIGASSGIGKSLAEVFSRNNYEVGLTARRVELLKDIQSKLPVKSYIKYMDLLKPEDSMVAFQELVQEMNGVDIVVINSGVGFEAEKLDFSKERPAIDVNVLGFTAMAVASTNYFEDKGSGHIVAISSIAAIRPYRTCPAYGASKSFISFYLKGLRHKFNRQKRDIYVTDIQPGFVYTPLTQNNKKMFWVATAEKAAMQTYNAIVKKKKHAYVTRRWLIVAWFLKVLPDFLYNRA